VALGHLDISNYIFSPQVIEKSENGEFYAVEAVGCKSILFEACRMSDLLGFHDFSSVNEFFPQFLLTIALFTQSFFSDSSLPKMVIHHQN